MLRVARWVAWLILSDTPRTEYGVDTSAKETSWIYLILQFGCCIFVVLIIQRSHEFQRRLKVLTPIPINESKKTKQVCIHPRFFNVYKIGLAFHSRRMKVQTERGCQFNRHQSSADTTRHAEAGDRKGKTSNLNINVQVEGRDVLIVVVAVANHETILRLLRGDARTGGAHLGAIGTGLGRVLGGIGRGTI